MKKLSLLILFVVCNYTFAQTPIVDNLKNDYLKETDKQLKIEKLINYCFYSESLHNDTLLYYSQVLKKLVADENSIGKTALADFYYALGISKKGLLDSSLAITLNALQGLNYGNEYKNSYTRLKRQEATIAMRKQQYQKSLEIMLPLLNDATQRKDTLMQLLNIGTIGLTYMEMEQNEEAIKWFSKNLGYVNYIPYKRFVGILYANLAALYNETKKNDSAFIFVAKSIAINKEYEMLSTLANSYAIQSDILTDVNRIKEAEAPLLNAIELRKLINDPYYIVSDMAQLGIFYANNKHADKGIAICKEGIEIATKFKLDAKLLFLYNTLAQNYKAANNAEGYTTTLEKIISIKDSIYTKNSAKEMAESKAKYEAKELEIKANDTKFKKTKTTNTVLWVILLLVLAGFLIFYIKKK